MVQQNRKCQIEQRRAEVSRFYLRGATLVEISREVRVSVTTVWKDLQSVRQEWLQSSLRNFDEARARELAKIDEIERQAWIGWNRSLRDWEQRNREISRETGSRSDGSHAASDESAKSKPGRAVKTSVARRGQCGNPQFLMVVQQCVSQRCRLLGLESALQSGVSGTLRTPDQDASDMDATVPRLPPADESPTDISQSDISQAEPAEDQSSPQS